MGIILKSRREIEMMRDAGKIVAEILQVLRYKVKSGMKTKELDEITMTEIKKHKAQSSFLGYRGFPASICVSVNDEIVHGIPGEREIKSGDIVSLDVGAIYKGYQGDAAISIGIDKISPKARELLEVTENALKAGISAAKHNSRLGDIGWAIQHYAESRGFSVVREYTGHGIGRSMHEDPLVPNIGHPGEGIPIQKGMVFALEPMVNVGGWQTRVAANKWTVLTKDGSLSAHFEHTIAITDDEAQVLTAI
mgnify:CR=1 FL=1